MNAPYAFGEYPLPSPSPEVVATWKPIETFEGPSFWGHERLYLPKDERMKFRNKRMETAAEGKQAPLLIDCPWLFSNITDKK